MTQKALKLALEALEVDAYVYNGEKSWKAITAIKKALAQEKALQALHHENERLGLYKDAYAEQKLQIKTTDPFESSRVGDYNRGWNDCLFASGIVKQPEPLEKFCDSNCVWTDHHPDCKLAQPQQEPVNYEKLAALGWQSIECPFCGSAGAQAFPQRTWVRLTDEDISEIVRGTHNTGSFVRAIEAKLKEKNCAG